MTRSVQDILLFPCNGNALEALGCLGDEYRMVGFVDDTPEKQGREAYGHPVFGREALARWSGAGVLAVPGSPTSFRSRRKVIEGLGIGPERFVTVIHPRASVSPLARMGRNVLVMAGVVVTSTAIIGDNVCILPNTVIHHDVTVGAWSLVGSNVTIAGGTTVGANCYIGSGSSIRNGLRIGEGCLLGMGSNVIRDVEAGLTLAGNPARVIRAKAG